jgi:hypothetical protein
MTQIDEATRIQGYPDDPPRRKEEPRFKTYEYEEDNHPDDIHYSFRVIRVTVVDQNGGAS